MKPQNSNSGAPSAPEVKPPAAAAAAAAPEVKPPAPADLVGAAHDALQTALGAAVQGLGVSLRVMIANQFAEADGGRRTAENAFEAAKNLAAAKATREGLAAAIEGLTTAVNHVANHSLKFPGDLDALRNELRKVTKAAEEYDQLAAKLAKA